MFILDQLCKIKKRLGVNVLKNGVGVTGNDIL